jgi:hypothetical protein
MPKRSKDSVESPSRGRRAGDPNARRSYRYVMRMHPDLADALNALADESGLSRSLFVERVLISFVNQDPRTALDHIGRRVRHDTPTGGPPRGSLASFGRQWQRWAALRHEVFGEDVNSELPAFDDHGRDKQGHGQRIEPRPPVPKHLLAPDFSRQEKIHPHRGGGRKK